MEGSELAEAIAALAALKAEHRALMMRIAADSGMEPETRSALVAHVLEEEDEKVARIVALASAAPTATAPRRGGLTVGSLRPERPGPASSLGSLRED